MKLLDTGTNSASKNMELDAQFLENLEDEPILHLYEWETPSLTYGHFVKPEEFLDLEACKEHNLSLAKRPTGGGLIFHLTDYAFSFLLPASHPHFSQNTLENYKTVNDKVVEAIGRISGLEAHLLPLEPTPLDSASMRFCMAKPTKYDVILEGKKVGGSAQRKTKKGFLHQGSISLFSPPMDLLKKVLLPNTRVLESMNEHSFYLNKDKILVKNSLIDVFSNNY